MTTTTVNGVDLCTMHGGDGFPLVLVHGFTGSKEDWSYVAPTLCRHFRVLSYDQRGHGQSSKPEDPSAYTFDTLADDLAGLLDALRIERCHLMGHSLGGVVLQRYLVRHGAGRVGRLVLVDTTHRGGPRRELEQRIEEAERYGMKEMTAREAAAAGPNPLEQLMPDVVQFMRRRQEEMSQAAFIALGNALLELADTRPDLAGLDVPTLVVCGSRDERTPPEVNRALADALNGRYVEISGAGHTPQFENMPAFLDAVVPFLREGSE